MADYYPLIAKAVAGLEKSSGEARRALYVRARTALVTQLRGVTPALSESDITRERLALEEAIRKVEAEAARKSRFDPPPERKRADRGEIADPVKSAAQPPRDPSPAPGGEHEDHDNPESTLSGTAADLRRPVRTPPPEGGPLSNDGLKGFRNVVADAENLGDATAQAGRSAREAYAAMPSPSPEFDRLEPRLEPEGLRSRNSRMSPREVRRDSPQTREPPPRQAPSRPSAPANEPPAGREPASRDTSRDRSARDRTPPPRERPTGRDITGSREPMPDFEMSPRPEPVRADEFSARDFESGSDFSLEPDMPDADHDAAAARNRTRRRVETAAEEAPEREVLRPTRRLYTYAALLAALVLVTGALAWEWQPMVGALRGLTAPSRGVAPAQPQPSPSRQKITDRIGASDTASTSPQGGADVAQRVVLYEEDPDDPAGKRFVGSVVWHTENAAPGATQPSDVVVRADIEIPERKMTMKWSLQRNSDKTLPASHMVQVVFTLPPDFPHGGVQNVPGVLMKESEQMRGVPLAGTAVKVTDGYFLIGLSAVDSEMQRNVALLKDRPWFDVPIVYTDGRRAILAVEKGTPGERAFNDAFAAWKP
jgi:hypothetical protein